MENRSTIKSDRRSWLWLGIATFLVLFSNGRWVIPPAAWLAPIFFLRFIHSQKPMRGLVIGGIAISIACVISWQDMTPLKDNILLYILVFLGIGWTFWLPYCADRLLSPRIRGFASTLVLPLAAVSVELVYTLTNPFMSWGSLAYTQSGWLALVQLVSITGIWGVTFLIAWFASVVHWAWRQEFSGPAVRRGVFTCLSVLVVVICYGEIRMTWFRPRAETVRVAAVAATDEDIARLENAQKDPGAASTHHQAVLDDYLSRTRQIARSGARIVVWDELAVHTTLDQESAVIELGRGLAGEQHIYLLMALWVELPSDSRNQSRKNEAVLIGPDGTLLWEYLKARPTPGSRDVAGDGLLALAGTPVGRLATVICYDMDDPALLRQAGRARAELLLAPTWDYFPMENMHLSMAVFRAVENGLSLVRSTRGGFSAAMDGQGRLLASSGQNTVERTLIADVPMESQWTLYPVIGDLFGWLGVAGLVILSVIGIFKPRLKA